MAQAPDLRRLKALITAAEAAMSAPSTEGETRPFVLEAYLPAEAPPLRSQSVAYVKREHPSLYNLFVGETLLEHETVAQLHGYQSVPTPAELADAIRVAVTAYDEWLVETMLLNLAMPCQYIPLTDRVGLERALPQPQWSIPEGKEEQDPYAAHKHLGDDLPRRARRQPDVAQREECLYDTRIGAVLQTIESGTESVALAVAPTRARLMLATWCLLSPPEDHVLWPSVGPWAPAPFERYGPHRKPFERGAWTKRSPVRGAATDEWGEYPLPAADTRSAPFEAMDVAATTARHARS